MRLLPLVLAAALAGSAVRADPVVVELFTSQGCSSCPPADALLAELVDRDDVIALSFHVDYWDWIGWADTFGAAAHSERQRRYAAAAGSTMVYTPQFVVGGREHVAGAKGLALADAVQSRRDRTRDLLGVDGAGRLTLAPAGSGARLTLVLVRPHARVAVGGGENEGRVLDYRNVVVGLRDLGDWDGTAGVVEVVAAPEGLSRVVLAQAVDGDGHPGAILGAVALD